MGSHFDCKLVQLTRTWVVIFLIILVLPACSPIDIEPTPSIVSGIVHDEHSPVADAVVRVQTTNHSTITRGDGSFNLAVDGLGAGPFELTAWASGYFCGGPVEANLGDSEVELEIHAHSKQDNPDYAWLPSQFHPGQGEDQGCASCHSAAGSSLDITLPVDEWILDAHSGSASNPRFLTMYAGEDMGGNQSPNTRYGFHKDYGRFPLRPDPNELYYGPGYKLDFPDTAGNCAACHTPAASVNEPYGVDPREVTGVPAEGVPCDFCHKVWDVRLDSNSGLPFENMPGVLAYEFRRPPEDHQFFAGPLDDVAPGEDTYSPLQTQSQFCAPCHFGVFWGTVIYDSFGEWLHSPYNDPQNGKTCQDCHMPPLGVTYFALPEQGGLQRNPDTIFSHRMPGASDKTLLSNAVTLEADAQLESDELIVEVKITNDQTGHHVPTDSPLRQMILLVEAKDEGGQILPLREGPILPEWTGVGNPEEGYYAGLPGIAYAKVLEELWTEVSPTGAYWNPTRVISDNRLAALDTHTSSYVFESPLNGEAIVDVRLIFRRAFIELMTQKGWNVPDILMEESHIKIGK